MKLLGFLPAACSNFGAMAVVSIRGSPTNSLCQSIFPASDSCKAKQGRVTSSSQAKTRIWWRSSGLRHLPSSHSMDKWISKLEQCTHLEEKEMKQLCERVRSILIEESNIQPVSSPVTICGDIHGQFWDLLELLRKGGQIPETSYIFMVIPIIRMIS